MGHGATMIRGYFRRGADRLPCERLHGAADERGHLRVGRARPPNRDNGDLLPYERQGTDREAPFTFRSQLALPIGRMAPIEVDAEIFHAKRHVV